MFWMAFEIALQGLARYDDGWGLKCGRGKTDQPVDSCSLSFPFQVIGWDLAGPLKDIAPD